VSSNQRLIVKALWTIRGTRVPGSDQSILKSIIFIKCSSIYLHSRDLLLPMNSGARSEFREKLAGLVL
jgi:hypothetical protein